MTKDPDVCGPVCKIVLQSAGVIGLVLGAYHLFGSEKPLINEWFKSSSHKSTPSVAVNAASIPGPRHTRDVVLEGAHSATRAASQTSHVLPNIYPKPQAPGKVAVHNNAPWPSSFVSLSDNPIGLSSRLKSSMSSLAGHAQPLDSFYSPMSSLKVD